MKKSLNKSIEFIKFNSHEHDVNTMCSVLGIARSTYYKKLTSQNHMTPSQCEALARNAA